MPDPSDPTYGEQPPDASASAHVDASTLALLAETDLDPGAVRAFAELLQADDPDLPTQWHPVPLLAAATHLASCGECGEAQGALLRALTDLVAEPIGTVSPAQVDTHVARALDAFALAVAGGAVDATAARSAHASPDSARRRWSWLPRSKSSGPTAGGGDGFSRSGWVVAARDRRVLVAMAIALAVAVPLLVRAGRPEQQSAVKTADTTTASDTTTVTRAQGPALGGAVSGAGAASDESAAQPASKAIDDDHTVETTVAETFGADVESAVGAASETTAAAAAPAPPPAAAPAPPIVGGVAAASPTAPPTTRAATAPRAKRAAPTKVKASAESGASPASDDSGPTLAATATAAAPVVPRDLGPLGSFEDDAGAVEAFQRVQRSPSAGSVAPAATPPVDTATTGAPPVAPVTAAPAATAPASPTAPGASASTPSTRAGFPCPAATADADTAARAVIRGVDVVIVSRVNPAPGRVLVLAVDGCVVRLDLPL